MGRSPLARRGAVAALVALVAVINSGCASSPPTTLAERQARMVSRLAMQCYLENEGARLAQGSLEVMVACRHWARSRARATVPAGIVPMRE